MAPSAFPLVPPPKEESQTRNGSKQIQTGEAVIRPRADICHFHRLMNQQGVHNRRNGLFGGVYVPPIVGVFVSQHSVRVGIQHHKKSMNLV